MPRTKKTTPKTAHETFGRRLARLRTAAGFTQRELATMLGISQRMVAYYEGDQEHLFTQLIPQITEALGVTADELLGLEASRSGPRPANQRLWRRFRMIEQLPARERKQLLSVVDTFLDRDKLARTQAAS